jgi:hypothetical protein
MLSLKNFYGSSNYTSYLLLQDAYAIASLVDIFQSNSFSSFEATLMCARNIAISHEEIALVIGIAYDKNLFANPVIKRYISTPTKFPHSIKELLTYLYDKIESN